MSTAFSTQIIRWQKKHGRHHLPWQQTRDAYRIWLSEIMLQQTQVATVIPYYQRFITRFPDVFSLASASSEQVMAHWSGLGYYSRARNLHACAKRIVQEYGGIFPQQPALLAELPGIGRSTAAAISAFAFSRRAAILDGNVKRVLTRVFGVDGVPSTKSVEDELWRLAEALLPITEKEIQSYTQGLMDFGATLCTRTKPVCTACPLQQSCVALATNRVAELPAKKLKRIMPTKRVLMLVVVGEQQFLLEKRPSTGIWGGLLSLPELPIESDLHQAEQFIKSFGVLERMVALEKISHTFTHFKLEINPYLCNLKHRLNNVVENTHVWYALDQCPKAPLPAPIKKLLLQMPDAAVSLGKTPKCQ